MPFNSSRRSKRHKNKNKGEETKEPFFSKSDQTKVQKKEDNTFFQTKLSIGQPGDKYEKEADTMADAVVNKTNNTPEVQQKEVDQIQRVTLATPQEDEKFSTAEQRMEEDKLIQEKSETEGVKEEEKPDMMAKSESMTNNAKASNTVSQKIEKSKGSGRPLSKKVRSEMENSFGTDFSNVNIHTGKNAVELNQELGAQAFTTGKDVYFNQGKFNPESSQGKHLLAHELTHVVQQGAAQKDKPAIQKLPDPNCSRTSGLSLSGSCLSYRNTCYTETFIPATSGPVTIAIKVDYVTPQPAWIKEDVSIQMYKCGTIWDTRRRIRRHYCQSFKECFF